VICGQLIIEVPAFPGQWPWIKEMFQRLCDNCPDNPATPPALDRSCTFARTAHRVLLILQYDSCPAGMTYTERVVPLRRTDLMRMPALSDYVTFPRCLFAPVGTILLNVALRTSTLPYLQDVRIDRVKHEPKRLEWRWRRARTRRPVVVGSRATVTQHGGVERKASAAGAARSYSVMSPSRIGRRLIGW
jgi:hypothetical protein